MVNSRSLKLDGHVEVFRMRRNGISKRILPQLLAMVSALPRSMLRLVFGILHIDLKTAFLQEETYDLERRVIHVQLPSDIGLTPYLVGLCTRSVYGLADAPRRWWNRLDKFLISLGIQPTRADRCTYVCSDGAFKNDDVSSGTKTPKQVSYYVDSPSCRRDDAGRIVRHS